MSSKLARIDRPFEQRPGRRPAAGRRDMDRWTRRQAGKVGWALLWLLGVPLPILIIIYLIRGH